MSGNQYLPLYNDIMNAGELVLRQYGIERASLADVSRLLRYTPIQLSFFFGSRESLWEAIIARRLEEIVACLSLTSNGEDNRAAEGRLCAALDNLDPRHSDFDGLEWSRAGLDAASPADSPAGMAWANLSVPACAAYQSPSQI